MLAAPWRGSAPGPPPRDRAPSPTSRRAKISSSSSPATERPYPRDSPAGCNNATERKRSVKPQNILLFIKLLYPIDVVGLVVPVPHVEGDDGDPDVLGGLLVHVGEL